MATVTHVIRSHYDPTDHERLERETGQRPDEQSDPWQTEPSFSAQRRTRAAPTFVPATISHDDWGVPSHASSPPVVPEESARPSTSSAEWYKSVTASREAPLRPSSAPVQRPTPPDEPRREAVPSKNDWFIRRALRSVPATKPSSPAPSLADMLARDPPPLPTEGRYTPPVWLHLGPSNRGFRMLQRSGWSEGEGLGAHAVRRAACVRDLDKRASSSSSSVKVKEDRVGVRGAPEVIDLALSNSEESENAFEDCEVIQESVQTQAYSEKASASHVQRSLLTPLPTVLKADRLGIGLKAKTEGPYKQSKKRITHSAAAIAAHNRSAQEMRRHKAAVGKGKRGFAMIHKREEDRRKLMLAYLNE